MKNGEVGLSVDDIRDRESCPIVGVVGGVAGGVARGGGRCFVVLLLL